MRVFAVLPFAALFKGKAVFALDLLQSVNVMFFIVPLAPLLLVRGVLVHSDSFADRRTFLRLLKTVVLKNNLLLQ